VGICHYCQTGCWGTGCPGKIHGLKTEPLPDWSKRFAGHRPKSGKRHRFKSGEIFFRNMPIYLTTKFFLLRGIFWSWVEYSRIEPRPNSDFDGAGFSWLLTSFLAVAGPRRTGEEVPHTALPALQG